MRIADYRLRITDCKILQSATENRGSGEAAKRRGGVASSPILHFSVSSSCLRVPCPRFLVFGPQYFCLLPFAFCFLLCFFLPSPAFAGHGFASSFTNIEWLPEPGRTPDSALYRLDAAQEEGKLFLAQTVEAKLRLCLTFAREKLAELEAMIKAEKAEAAKIAAERYHLYVNRAQQLTTESTSDKELLADLMANALLEHQYILSVIYEELPASTRAVVPEVIAFAQEQYQLVTKLLSPKKKGALFFKEEEVRWSVQMAMRTEESSQ